MVARTAKFISGLFSPFITIPFFGLWTILYFSNSPTIFLKWAILFIALVAITPLALILIELNNGKITDIHVAAKEQRLGPFIVATLGSITLGLLYHYYHAPSQLVSLAAALAVSGLIFGLLSHYWKISIHSAAFAGGVFIVSNLIDYHFLFLLILLPIIIWARITRERHDLWQAITAAILVCLCVYLAMKLF